MSTKIHACVESLGNAVRLLATPGHLYTAVPGPNERAAIYESTDGAVTWSVRYPSGG